MTKPSYEELEQLRDMAEKLQKDWTLGDYSDWQHLTTPDLILALLDDLARVRGLLRSVQERQPHQQVRVEGLDFSVDEKIAPLVKLINNGAIQTLSSCQGNPGIIGEGGSYGHVSLRSKDLLPLASVISELLRDYRDDEVMVDVQFTSQPYITVSFRHEAISIVENAFRLQQNSETTVSTDCPGYQSEQGGQGTTADKSVKYFRLRTR